MHTKDFAMLRSRWILNLGLVAGFAACVPSVLADDLYTETVQNSTGSSQSQLNVVLSGNVPTSQIDGTLNPFGSGGSYSLSYDSVNNRTTVSFTGGSPVANGSSINVGYSATQPEQIVSKYWGSAQSSPPSSLLVPVVSIADIGTGNGVANSFFDVFVTLGTGQTDAFQLPIASSQSQRIVISNPGVTPEFISSLTYGISNTEIPLDELNQNLDPVGSSPLPGFNPITLNPGTSFDSGDFTLPEPSTFSLLVLGLGGLVLRRRR
jgi:hypothetical protein